MPSRTNEAWLSDLATPGPAREAALEDLRVIIQKGLPYALSRWLSPDQPQFNSLVEEVTQETLLRVLDQLNTFEGRSQFTTWVHKIAVRIALTELRRKRWRDSSLDELTENEDVPPPPGLLADPQASPETSAERAVAAMEVGGQGSHSTRFVRRVAVEGNIIFPLRGCGPDPRAPRR